MLYRNALVEVDWPEIILECRRYGLRRAARELGIHHSLLQGWEGGKEPSHSRGQQLILFWLRRTGNTIGALPTLNKKPAIEQAFLCPALPCGEQVGRGGDWTQLKPPADL